MERIGNKVSYIRKPMARRGFVAAGLAASSIIFCAASLLISVGAQGNGSLLVAALGLCSMLTAVSAAAYGGLSFLEKEKNYLLAKIGLAAAGLQMFAWVLIFVNI